MEKKNVLARVLEEVEMQVRKLDPDKKMSFSKGIEFLLDHYKKRKQKSNK